MSDENARNPAFEQLRAELVRKPDGRYLIYYSSGSGRADDPSGAAVHAPTPQQTPWNPQGGPAEDGSNSDV